MTQNSYSNSLHTPHRQLRDENIFDRMFTAATGVVAQEVRETVNNNGGIIKMPQPVGSTPPYSPAPPVPQPAPEKSDLTKTVSDYVKAIPPAGYIGGAAAGTATYFATKGSIGLSVAATVLGTAVSGVIANKIKQHKGGK